MSTTTLRPATLLVRHRTDDSAADPVVTPVYQASAFRAGDPYFYTRNSNPNFAEVEELLAALDGAAGSVLFASGMAAIAATLGILAPGDGLVVHRLIYGCSYRLLQDRCAQLGIRLHLVDLADPAARAAALATGPRLVLLETPTNPFLRTLDLERLATELRRASPGALLVVDNTWATPLLQRPLQHGADLAVYSGSKFFSGHSDLILGLASARDPALVERLRQTRFYQGAVPDPFAAWLLRRSLQTLALRLERHVDSSLRVRDHLRQHPAVARLYWPEVDGHQLTGYGGMLFFELAAATPERVERFVGALRLFDRGTPLACVSSAVAVPYAGSHLSMTADEKAAIGLTPTLLRLSVGIEDPADLIADLDQALAAVDGASAARSP